MSSNADTGVRAPQGDTSRIRTDYAIGQDNMQGTLGPVRFDIHNPVFVVSAVLILGFIAFTLVFAGLADTLFNALFEIVTKRFDWLFLSAANVITIFCVALAFTPLGAVRLGGPEARPDFGYGSWFAMLFAAGMGIGLMFYGVLEPVYHMQVSQPLGLEGPLSDGRVDPAQLAEARAAGLAATMYHWALHPWAIYAVVAISLGLFAYNKGLPLAPRSVFYPFFGERIWGWTGHVIDILSIIATLFGLATSLGLGAQQANAGMAHAYGIPQSTFAQVVIIGGVTAVALGSVLRGVRGGVRVLSNVNMAVAILLLVFVFAVGPTGAILGATATGLATYAADLIPLSNPFGRDDDTFRQDWTSFYWAWWISVSPFVGMFIARVSRGRTVREMVISVILVPSAACILWMGVFGGAAIEQVVRDPAASAVKDAVIDNYNASLALFAMLDGLPLAQVTSTVAIVLVLVFFVTTSDSGSLVIDAISAGGKADAPKSQRAFWATIEGAIAITLLVGGGLNALQSMVISTGLVFAFVLLAMCWATYSGLRREPR